MPDLRNKWIIGALHTEAPCFIAPYRTTLLVLRPTWVSIAPIWISIYSAHILWIKLKWGLFNNQAWYTTFLWDYNSQNALFTPTTLKLLVSNRACMRVDLVICIDISSLLKHLPEKKKKNLCIMRIIICRTAWLFFAEAHKLQTNNKVGI